MKIRSVAARGRHLGCRCVARRRRAGLADAAGQGHHHHQRRRPERHLHARARRGAAPERWGQPLIIENRPGGSMNIGTRACADAPPDGYTICITNADAMLYNQFLFKKLPFDPETSLQPITNAFHLIHMLVVNSQARREERRRALRAVEGEGRHAVLSRARRAARALHGDAEEGEGLRLGARAVPGGGEAVNAIMSGSTPIALFGEGNVIGNIQRRPDDAARDDEQHPLAEFPEGAAADRGRLQRPAVAELVRHLRAGRHAEADRRQGVQGRSARSSTSRSSATAISPRGASCRRPTRRSSSPRT